jgi:hypothetical protein
MFSRPVISGWKPAPSSISAAMRPFTETFPCVGLRMPEMSFSSVDLPEPLRPMIPNASPRSTEKETFFSATTEASAAGLRSRFSSALLSVANCERRPQRR